MDDVREPRAIQVTTPRDTSPNGISISSSFYIDIRQFLNHRSFVTKRLAIAPLPNRAAGCCSPRAKQRTNDVAPYAALFRALADETRLDILVFLAAAGQAICVCEIEDHVRLLSQPTISHHLRQLREAGLVTAERRGTWIYYAVDKSLRARLTEFATLFEG